MLRLPDFTYIRPRTLAEASGLLKELGPEAMAVAGGTDVYPKMKRGQFTPRYLVSLGHVEENRGIRREEGRGLWIGAGETLSAIAGHEGGFNGDGAGAGHGIYEGRLSIPARQV